MDIHSAENSIFDQWQSSYKGKEVYNWIVDTIAIIVYYFL